MDEFIKDLKVLMTGMKLLASFSDPLDEQTEYGRGYKTAVRDYNKHLKERINKYDKENNNHPGHPRP